MFAVFSLSFFLLGFPLGFGRRHSQFYKLGIIIVYVYMGILHTRISYKLDITNIYYVLDNVSYIYINRFSMNICLGISYKLQIRHYLQIGDYM